MSPRSILKELGYNLSYFTQNQIDNIVQHLRKKSIAGEEFTEGYVKEKKTKYKIADTKYFTRNNTTNAK